MSIQIPPMPQPDDFRDDSGYLSMIAFQVAVNAWERVAKHAIEHQPAPPGQETPEP